MNALKQYNFKEAFVEFLVENWENDLYSDIVRDKQVYITSKERCYSFRNVNGKLKKNEEHHLYNYQEEAGYRMVYHLYMLPSPGNAVVRAEDTDVLLILLANLHRLPTGFHIWMELGSFLEDTLRMVDIASSTSRSQTFQIIIWFSCFHWLWFHSFILYQRKGQTS